MQMINSTVSGTLREEGSERVGSWSKEEGKRGKSRKGRKLLKVEEEGGELEIEEKEESWREGRKRENTDIKRGERGRRVRSERGMSGRIQGGLFIIHV